VPELLCRHEPGLPPVGVETNELIEKHVHTGGLFSFIRVSRNISYDHSVVHSPQSAVRSPQSAVRSPQSMSYTDRNDSGPCKSTQTLPVPSVCETTCVYY